jgi:predicted nuclease of predicted toxin-antitoxin system
MMSELEPKYLVDACVPLGLMELWSGEYVEVTRILPDGTSDEMVFEEAKKRGLTVITCDRGFVVMAIRENIPIIWQYGSDRFLIHGNIVERNCSMKSPRGKRTRDLLRRDAIILP